MNAPQKTGLRDRKRRETRARLEDAAVTLVLRDGLEETTIGTISELADVSPRTFFNYFDSKESAIMGLRHLEITDEIASDHVANDDGGDLVASVVHLLFAVMDAPVSRPTIREDRLEIAISELLSDVSHDMGSPDAEAGLAKDGVEAHLQELLAEQPAWCGEGFRLVRREWPTDIGPVDLMCRDAEDGWVAVEIKRVAGIEAVEQLTRYLERIRCDPAFASCRGVLAAQAVKPQARVLAQSRGIEWVEVDLAVLRGEREPDLKLFAA